MKNSDLNVLSHDLGHLKKSLLKLACAGQRFKTNAIGQWKVD